MLSINKLFEKVKAFSTKQSHENIEPRILCTQIKIYMQRLQALLDVYQPKVRAASADPIKIEHVHYFQEASDVFNSTLRSGKQINLFTRCRTQSPIKMTNQISTESEVKQTDTSISIKPHLKTQNPSSLNAAKSSKVQEALEIFEQSRGPNKVPEVQSTTRSDM